MYTFFYKYLKSITVVTIMFMITAFALTFVVAVLCAINKSTNYIFV